MKFKRLLLGLLVALLPSRRTAVLACLLALPACSTVKYVREKPPVELLADCPAVEEQIKTNGQLAQTILAYRASVATCNTDKESLRKWAEQP